MIWVLPTLGVALIVVALWLIMVIRRRALSGAPRAAAMFTVAGSLLAGAYFVAAPTDTGWSILSIIVVAGLLFVTSVIIMRRKQDGDTTSP